MDVPDKPWKLLVNDNFNSGETATVPVAAFDTVEETTAECRSRVDAWLETESVPGMSADQLFEHFVTFGEDPWILGGTLRDGVPFSAWDYARERCHVICRSGGVS